MQGRLLWLFCAILLTGQTSGLFTKRDKGRGGGGNDDRGGGHDDNNDDTGGVSTTPVTSSSSVNGTAGPGDTKCMTLLCVSAVVNTNNTVTYVLQSTGAATLGWMAIGFGTQMPNSPMVIMWPNSDGTTTLSQREASGHVMPTVVANPPRIATLVTALTQTTGVNPKLTFNVPADGSTTQNCIWAFGSSNPSSTSVDATIQMHIQSGIFQLNLAANSAALDPVGQSSVPGSTGDSHDLRVPLTSYQKLIVVHAALSAVGFLLLLPTGVLVARYLRTVSPNWFKGHAYIQFWIAGPVILVGFILAVLAVNSLESGHFNDKHKTLGLVIFMFYVLQCGLGAFIHWVKDPHRKRRPPQNYLHAVFGLTTIALSTYQVWLGFAVEWFITTGRDDVPRGVDKIWLTWTILLAIAYFGGLAFLRKQFQQEKDAADKKSGALQMTMMRNSYRQVIRA